jgi:hypothetical protein
VNRQTLEETGRFLGLAVLEAVLHARGDDEVVRYLPELAGTAYDGATIQHILTMSSGVAWSEDYFDPESDVARLEYIDSEEQLISYMASLPRSGRPGWAPRPLVLSGVTDPAMGTADATTAGPYLENFANGNTGMIIMANWWQSALQDAMGDDFEYVATAPVPTGPDGDTARGVSYSWLTVVNNRAGDAEQEAAWTFLSWLNGPDSGENGSSAMGDLLMSMGILPSRTSDLDAHGDALDTPFLSTYVDGISRAYAFPIVLGGEELTNTLQERIENVVFGQLSAADATTEAQQEAEAILDRAGS